MLPLGTSPSDASATKGGRRLERKLVYGGAFNPIHHGHLLCARAAAEAGGFGRVVLIPTGVPPHRPADSSLAPAEHRLAMTRLAVAGDSHFEVSDIELRQSGPNYTLDTVRRLKAEAGWQAVDWLIGADQLLSLPKWHQPDQLMAEARLWVMARPGQAIDWTVIESRFAVLKERILPAPLIDISATLIRNRVAAGKSVRYLIPETVEKYIAENNLYVLGNPAK